MPKLTIAILLDSVGRRLGVAAGLCEEYNVRYHSSVQELLATIEHNDVSVVIVDATDSAGRSMASVISTVRRGFPTVPVLAYCTLSPTSSGAILDAARAGATGLLLRGIDDVAHAMRSAVRSARRGAVTQRIHSAMAPLLPQASHAFLQYALNRAADEPSVSDAARTLGIDRKTLQNRLRSLGLVKPREFLNWVRLATAVGMLEDPRRSAEQVALDLGFPSGTAFRNMLRRYVDATCSTVRASGGLEYVLARFRTRLRAADQRSETVLAITAAPIRQNQLRPKSMAG